VLPRPLDELLKLLRGTGQGERLLDQHRLVMNDNYNARPATTRIPDSI
jgi:hypothetical protein